MDSPKLNSTAHFDTRVPSVTPNIVNITDVHCDKCDFTSGTAYWVKIHKGTQHKDIQKPEELRYDSPNKSLTLTPVREPREEETEVVSSQENINLSRSTKVGETQEDETSRQQRLQLNMSEKEFKDWKQELRDKITKEGKKENFEVD